MSTLDITNGERLLIQRRRCDESQAQAALRHQVPVGVYGQWERDQESNRPAPKVAVGKLTLNERCVLERIRRGESQKDLANALGLCVFWVGRMERGEINCDRIVEHYEIV